MNKLNLHLIIFFIGLVSTVDLLAKKYTGSLDLGVAWNKFMVTADQIEPVRKFPFESCFEKSSEDYDIPKVLLLALARGESDFNPKAKSKANARGLMQILWPSTARYLNINTLDELLDPCTNVDGGARYLRELLDTFDGDAHLALAAYNYGPHRISPDKAMPSGAEWYSGYIYRHLEYVTNGNTAGSKSFVTASLGDQKMEIIRFQDFNRAETFTSYLLNNSPDLRLDIFKTHFGNLKVYLIYADASELKKSKRSLKRLGFVVN